MTCFVDTSAFLAILDASDVRHEAAHQFWVRLVQDQTPLVTTSYVVIESCAVTQRRFGVDAVRSLLEDILPVVSIHWIDESIHSAATGALLIASPRQLSLVDCVSFEVMRRLGIRNIFAFDPHFAEGGFTCLPGAT